MNKPKVGQLVYVQHLSLKDEAIPTARISEREFYRVAKPSWAKGETRWVIGPVGKAVCELETAPYGMAYKPESVFETREKARATLNERINLVIIKLLALKA